MHIRAPNLWVSLLRFETHALAGPSELCLHLAGRSWEVGVNPRNDLVGELLVHAIRFVGELVVSALEGSN